MVEDPNAEDEVTYREKEGYDHTLFLGGDIAEKLASVLGGRQDFCYMSGMPGCGISWLLQEVVWTYENHRAYEGQCPSKYFTLSPDGEISAGIDTLFNEIRDFLAEEKVESRSGLNFAVCAVDLTGTTLTDEDLEVIGSGLNRIKQDSRAGGNRNNLKLFLGLPKEANPYHIRKKGYYIRDGAVDLNPYELLDPSIIAAISQGLESKYPQIGYDDIERLVLQTGGHLGLVTEILNKTDGDYNPEVVAAECENFLIQKIPFLNNFEQFKDQYPWLALRSLTPELLVRLKLVHSRNEGFKLLNSDPFFRYLHFGLENSGHLPLASQKRYDYHPDFQLSSIARTLLLIRDPDAYREMVDVQNTLNIESAKSCIEQQSPELNRRYAYNTAKHIYRCMRSAYEAGGTGQVRTVTYELLGLVNEKIQGVADLDPYALGDIINALINFVAEKQEEVINPDFIRDCQDLIKYFNVGL